MTTKGNHIDGPGLPHDDALHHVTGAARYVSDLYFKDMLTGIVLCSPYPHARIGNVETARAKALPGVHAVLLACDIPGHNQMGPVVADEPCLAEGETLFRGQAVALIAADTEEIAREAASLIRLEYTPLPAILDIPQARAAASFMGQLRTICQGRPEAILREMPYQLGGSLFTGAQEHWYLETQACLCRPEEHEMLVLSSTQHPSETQALVAEVLGIKRHAVRVEVTRLGGAFGGKETQANHLACWSALLAHHTRRPVKMVLHREEDMSMTGKRHPFLAEYQVGYDNDGLIHALEVQLFSDGGACLDLSMAILERALFHIDNAYFIPHLRVSGQVCRTHHPPNTAFRGFGAPQAVAVIEYILQQIAHTLQIDPAEVRRRNFYGLADRNHTHYGQLVEDNRLPMLFDQLISSADYAARREEVSAFNLAHPFTKRGLALSPVKFGISFTTTFLNQAGALIHIYQDGSVLISHGGVEMGQGLHTKIRLIAAETLGIPLEEIRIGPTDTSRVPNTSATAASSGTDLNGMAVRLGAISLKDRLSEVAARLLQEKTAAQAPDPSQLVFRDGLIFLPDSGKTLTFKEVVAQAYQQQTSLSATGYYRTPGLHFDKAAGKGNPFHYYAFGMAVSEVEVDLLTGAHTCLRTDILHDSGISINPAIDKGQVCGGFVQGLGWCTTEEVVWDEAGMLRSDSPDTYKIPTACDIPTDLRITLLENAPNVKAVRQSKAVGEPPFILALSVWLAIYDALRAAQPGRESLPFRLPATYELIVEAGHAGREEDGK